ncbi:MAG TPA: FAD-dependent oxidoreductase [Streptosporangiaceae bacterium]|nr:FAD-dependent oxidoreductase [Streptosporangiaceae bacterium]
MRTDFAVIGAGICGLSAAWALTRRGHEVTVIDQAPTGHLSGGSHGSCRIFRLGYETPAYVALARRARDVWTELEDTCGERLLHPAPQLTFGPEMEQVRSALEHAGAHCELMSSRAAAERFGGVTVPGPVLYEPESAVIAADRALAVLARSCGSDERSDARVTALAEAGSRVRVSTTGGDIDAGRAIVCAGPWTPKLAASAGIAMPAAATMEQVAYLAPARADAGPMPILVHYGGEFPYGLPVPGSDLYKIGIHFGGPAVDPDRQDHRDDAGLVARIKQAATAFLPGFHADPVATERCIYDTTPDTDFIVDRVGAIVLGSGTSGHGFKFGPLIGEWLADLATGTGTSPASFALSRF